MSQRAQGPRRTHFFLLETTPFVGAAILSVEIAKRSHEMLVGLSIY